MTLVIDVLLVQYNTIISSNICICILVAVIAHECNSTMMLWQFYHVYQCHTSTLRLLYHTLYCVRELGDSCRPVSHVIDDDRRGDCRAQPSAAGHHHRRPLLSPCAAIPFARRDAGTRCTHDASWHCPSRSDTPVVCVHRGTVTGLCEDGSCGWEIRRRVRNSVCRMQGGTRAAACVRS